MKEGAQADGSQHSECPDAPRRAFVMRHMVQAGDGMALPQRLLSMR